MTGVLDPPWLPLVVAPTPLQRAPRLSAELGVEIWLKRDDLTGVGLGGNKVRGLEYLLADALREGCDCLVTGAGPQSNWTVLAALTARQAGLRPYVVCYGNRPAPTGNLLLHHRIGTELHFTGRPDRSTVDDGIAEVAARLRATGRRPYVVPRGGATPLGALGYVRATTELAAQCPGPPATVWVATGSGGMHAGLAAGAAMAGAPYQVVGVTVSRPADECRRRVAELAAGAVALAGADACPDVVVRDGWLGPGYGMPSRAGERAAELVAVTEGVFLDPVFGAKAMAALIAERATVPGPVVFVAGGGAGTLFAAPAVGMDGAM
ncbi:1-aminocyclopropane-1-carboxylate deaminase/D-cysteine desulfhydrase [Amycolatopsis alkalitolerans]|uniref:Pyridoxal-phosphate dependent enzyme n=1 Tax=Amycolatopsis alkalitolerans TaxID=2547244 RepID=A0A5C4M878_9PSEU|nr:pyridoxal-phosphate dependent enzyme [Amycolatopsis alkalitolerans]TNC28261.1 pyridoxal-phosphate dependent enzyme [Amycolatopsis alkalitolerans]